MAPVIRISGAEANFKECTVRKGDVARGFLRVSVGNLARSVLVKRETFMPCITFFSPSEHMHRYLFLNHVLHKFKHACLNDHFLISYGVEPGVLRHTKVKAQPTASAYSLVTGTDT